MHPVWVKTEISHRTRSVCIAAVTGTGLEIMAHYYLNIDGLNCPYV